MSAGFPNTLDFTPKKNAVKSHLRQQVLYPLNGTTVNPLETPIISIPCGKYGMYADPTNVYLQFTITNTDTTAFILDGSAYSVFDRITCTSSGTPLTDVQYQAPLAQAMLDMQVGVARGAGMTISYGTLLDNTNNLNRSGATIAAGASLNICIPLMLTAIDATFSSKLVPIGSIADLQLQFFMASVANSVQSTSAAAAWRISNFGLVMEFIELDAGAQADLDKMSGGKIQWSGELYRGYQFALNAGSSGDTVVVPVKCQSAKTILATYRGSALVNNVAACSTVTRANPFSTSLTGAGNPSFYVNIGSEAMPQVPIRSSAQMYLEMIKSQHTLYNVAGYQSQFNITNWNTSFYAFDTTTAANNSQTAAGSFMVGLDLEAFANKSDVVYSGPSIVGGTVLNIVQQYAANLAANTTMNVYMHCDAICTVENGQMTVVY